MSQQVTLDVIKEDFDPKLIAALYKNFSSQYNALLELIDNAVDDRIDGEKLRISVEIRGDETITIQNQNGRGMTLENLHAFFKWGVSRKEAKIGRYGQGGKAAIGYLAKSFKIKNHPKGSETGYLLDVEDWEDREHGFKEISLQTYNPLDKDKASVQIELSKLKKSFAESQVEKLIRITYRPLILNEDVEFLINGNLLSCEGVSYKEDTHEVILDRFKFHDENYALSGHFGVVTDESFERGFRRGVNVYQFGRCVSEHEYFSHSDARTKWSYEKLYGELTINFDLPLVMNKTDIDRDSEMWKTIEEIMHRKLNNVVTYLRASRHISSKDKKLVKTISKKAQQKSDDDSTDLELKNYGPNLLYKVVTDENGRKKIMINMDHKAYQRWSVTAVGKKLYIIMVYSLAKASENMQAKDAKRFHDEFSSALREQTSKLL